MPAISPQSGKKIFLDMKLLDIDNTVASGVENIAKMGMSMLTLHAYPKAMRAAVKAAKGSGLCLLGVTVLTSMDARRPASRPAISTIRMRWCCGAPNRRAMPAWAASSARRRNRPPCAPIVGPDMAMVTPGIRPIGSDKGDQKRVMTPADAHPRRIEPSGRRPPDRQGAGSEAGGPRHSGRDADGALAGQPLRNEEEDHGQGILDRPRRCSHAERYKDYVAAAKPAFEHYGANFLARGGTRRTGRDGTGRNVVIEFPSLQHAVDCYNSPEYQVAAKIRQEIADAEMVVVEGV